MLNLYSDRQIAKIGESGAIIKEIFKQVQPMIVPGVTTLQIDKFVEDIIVKAGAKPAFKGYTNERGLEPFQHSICASPNDVIVHGIPNDTPLVEGAVITVDVGVKLDNYFADSAWTFPVGKVDEKTQKLLDVGKEALARGVAAAMVKAPLWAIARAVQTHVEANGFHVVRECFGHGLGHKLHEYPEVRNHVEPKDFRPHTQVSLKPGIVIAIEPLINAGCVECKHEAQNKWPVLTLDGSKSVHFEHTIAITSDGKTKVLTDWN